MAETVSYLVNDQINNISDLLLTDLEISGIGKKPQIKWVKVIDFRESNYLDQWRKEWVTKEKKTKENVNSKKREN